MPCAAAALPLDVEKLRHLRQDDGLRTALRVLFTAREQMSTERTAAGGNRKLNRALPLTTANINAITALLRAFEMVVDVRHPVGSPQADEIARWRARAEDLAVAFPQLRHAE